MSCDWSGRVEKHDIRSSIFTNILVNGFIPNAKCSISQHYKRIQVTSSCFLPFTLWLKVRGQTGRIMETDLCIGSPHKA